MPSILYLTLYCVPGTPTPNGAVSKGAVLSTAMHAKIPYSTDIYLCCKADDSVEHVNRAKTNGLLNY